MALRLLQAMKLMLKVCISEGGCVFFKSENKRDGVRVRSQTVTEREEREKAEREIKRACVDLSQLVLIDFCYVYRVQQNVAEAIMVLPLKYLFK